jgi:hypothetical protein
MVFATRCSRHEPNEDVKPDRGERAVASNLTRDEARALRRLLVERRDDVARALRCRERDAQPR